MLQIQDNTLNTLANLSRRYPDLQFSFKEFRTSLQQFTTRHLEKMVVSDLVEDASFDVSFCGATLQFRFSAALDEAKPMGVITVYEPRQSREEDCQIGAITFNREGLSNLGGNSPPETDIVYSAAHIVAEFYRKLFTERVLDV